jgi:hypothetical protein
MAVMIDIPGIGQVEAKNAASEATLRAILQAMQGGGGRGAGGGRAPGAPGGGAPGGAGGAGGGGGGAQSTSAKAASFASKMAATAANNFGKSAGYAGQMAGQAGKMLSGVAGTVGFLGKGAMGAAKGIERAAIAGANLASELANVGDSLTAAARSLGAIPVIGPVVSAVFGAIAAAAEGVLSSFKDAAAGGATFGGRLGEFSAAASSAGMTMKDFGAFMRKNSEAMLGFGNNTESGARRFSVLSRQLQSSSSGLMALGYGTAEINQGLASYGSMMKQQGFAGKQSNAQLVSGAKNYLKELDALAKITGVERSAKEAEMQATLKDAQFQGAMAGKSEEVRKSFLNTLGGLAGGMQGPLGNFAKDILATGTATTEENQRLMSMMPASAAALNQMRQKLQRGEAVSEAERNNLNNLMAQEGAKASKNMGGAFAAAPEFAGTMNALTLAQSMQTDALKDAKKGQDAAAAGTDGQVEKLEKMKAALASLTNGIMMQLASSGGLEMMMDMFSKLAGFVIGVVIPGLQMLIPIIGKIWNGMTMLLEPIIESVTKTFGGMGDTLSAVDNILNWVFDTLNGVVRGGILIFESLMRGIDTLSGPFKRLGDTIFGVEESTGSFGDTLIDIGAAVGSALELLADIIGWTIDNAVIPLVQMFQDYVLPVLDSVYQTIKEYLTPILVLAGVAFLAFNAMTILGTIAKFAYIAAMVVATAGLAILAAGFAIAAAAVWLFTSPIGIAILVIGSLIAIFKKFGGDIEVVGNAFKWAGTALNGLLLSFKEGILTLLNKVPGMRGDFDEDLKNIAAEKEQNTKEREGLGKAITDKMDANVAKREAEAKAEDGKQTTGLMDDLKGLFGPKGAAQAAAAQRHKDEKRAQGINLRNNRPGKLGGGGGAGGAAPGSKDPKAAEGKPEIQMDYNASSESLLTQLAQKEGSALAAKPGATSPDMAKTTEALAAAAAEKKSIEAAAEKKKADEAAAKNKTEEEKKKADEDAKKKKEEEEKNKKPESAETLLAELNTKMATLLKYTFTVAHNTNENVTATRGLNKNLYKA